jgi:hypothetical protein
MDFTAGCGNHERIQSVCWGPIQVWVRIQSPNNIVGCSELLTGEPYDSVGVNSDIPRAERIDRILLNNSISGSGIESPNALSAKISIPYIRSDCINCKSDRG